MKNFTHWCYRHHQTLGLWACIFMVCWALSGLAHPIMSRLNPNASALSATLPPQAAHAIDPQRLRLSAGEFNRLRAFGHPHKGRTKSVLQLDGEQFFDAETYQPLPDFARVYAIWLARHFSGDQHSTIAALRKVTQFDVDYLPINRLLPVWRVDFVRDDGLRVYVDIEQGELATLVDDTKATTGLLFRALHTWHWWPHDASRRWVMTGALLLVATVGLLGLWLYLRGWRRGLLRLSRRGPTSRMLHAHLGGLGALALLSFCASGLLHLWWSDDHPQRGEQRPNSLAPTAVLLPDGWREAQWIAAGDLGFWRVRTDAHAPAPHHGHNAAPDSVQYLADGKPVADAPLALAQALAPHWLEGAKPIAATLQQHFSSDYGFINKRLPVVAIRTQTPSGQPGTTLYIQAHTRTLAAASTAFSRAEGVSFGYLHKWHHLDGLGRNLRDVLLGLTALGLISATLLGLWRYWLRAHRPGLTGPGSPAQTLR